MLDIIIAFMKGMKNTLIPIATAVIGLIIGLIIAWGIWPVNFTDAGPAQLREADFQRIYLTNLATVYKISPNQQYVNVALSDSEWPDVASKLQAICSMAQTVNADGDLIAAQDLETLATAVDPAGCASPAATAAASEGGSGILSVCLWGIILLALAALLFALWQRRSSGGAEYTPTPTRRPVMPEAPPSMEVEDGATAAGITPIASYRTTYSHGLDAYDDSFSIESANGDFLGECGVGISETLGTGPNKNVTAMEVWLFDKNDIRTITKVAMSDHAFFDDAIKAKLAPKGEPVLARPDEVIVLETEALIINAKITNMEYGDDPSLPDKSYFETFSIEISAWSKDEAAVASAAFDDIY